MRKIFIILTAVLLPLSAFETGAEVKKAVTKILLQKVTVRHSRSLTPDTIESCYCGMLGGVVTVTSPDLGEVEVTVTNTSTGESCGDSFDSSSVSRHLLSVSGDSGLYEVNYITGSGDEYEGTFVIE